MPEDWKQQWHLAGGWVAKILPRSGCHCAASCILRVGRRVVGASKAWPGWNDRYRFEFGGKRSPVFISCFTLSPPDSRDYCPQFSVVLCLFMAAAIPAFPVSPNPQSSTGSVFSDSKMNLLPSSWGNNHSLQVAVRKQKCGNLICTKFLWLIQHVIALHFLAARVSSNLRWFLKFIWRPNECTAAASGKALPALTADLSPSLKGYFWNNGYQLLITPFIVKATGVQNHRTRKWPSWDLSPGPLASN